MSITRAAAGYVCLVLLPVAALIGVLRAGEFIKAPMTIEGDWNLHLDNPPSCGPKFAPATRPAMKISQSGIFVQITLNTLSGNSLDGEAEAGSLHARSRQLLLTASRLSPSSIDGVFQVPGNSSCPTVPFHAERPSALP